MNCVFLTSKVTRLRNALTGKDAHQPKPCNGNMYFRRVVLFPDEPGPVSVSVGPGHTFTLSTPDTPAASNVDPYRTYVVPPLDTPGSHLSEVSTESSKFSFVDHCTQQLMMSKGKLSGGAPGSSGSSAPDVHTPRSGASSVVLSTDSGAIAKSRHTKSFGGKGVKGKGRKKSELRVETSEAVASGSRQPEMAADVASNGESSYGASTETGVGSSELGPGTESESNGKNGKKRRWRWKVSGTRKRSTGETSADSSSESRVTPEDPDHQTDDGQTTSTSPDENLARLRRVRESINEERRKFFETEPSEDTMNTSWEKRTSKSFPTSPTAKPTPKKNWSEPTTPGEVAKAARLTNSAVASPSSATQPDAKGETQVQTEAKDEHLPSEEVPQGDKEAVLSSVKEQDEDGGAQLSSKEVGEESQTWDAAQETGSSSNEDSTSPVTTHSTSFDEESSERESSSKLSSPAKEAGTNPPQVTVKDVNPESFEEQKLDRKLSSSKGGSDDQVEPRKEVENGETNEQSASDKAEENEPTAAGDEDTRL